MRAKEYVSHYIGEKPIYQVEQTFFTDKQETEQIKTANVVRTQPPVQEFVPLGYNRENILDRIARASFFSFDYGINPNLEASYNTNHRVNYEQYVRSTTDSYGINSNQFIWDAIPELENFPVSGRPKEVSQQYVLYNVEPAWLAKTQKTLHIHKEAVPMAYDAANPTSKRTQYAYQTPVSQLIANVNGTSIFTKIKMFLVGK